MKSEFLKKYITGEKATKAIYGSVLIFAFLIGQSQESDSSPLNLVAATVFASVAIVLAEIYSELLGKTIKYKRKLKKPERLELEKDSLTILSIGLYSAMLFLLSYLGLYSLSTAFNLAYSFLLIILFAASYVASRLSNYNKRKSFFVAIITTIVGLITVFTKYLVGH